jgi:hypothetical protein
VGREKTEPSLEGDVGSRKVGEHFLLAFWVLTGKQIGRKAEVLSELGLEFKEQALFLTFTGLLLLWWWRKLWLEGA